MTADFSASDLTQDADRQSLESSDYSALARGSAEKTDKILGIEITKRLGEGWMLADLKGRLQSVRYRDEPQETLMLDGKPIMELWPIELNTENGDGKIMVTASRRYRTFSQNV